MQTHLRAFVGIVLASLSLQAYSLPFTNGDFSSGSLSWNDASSSGTATVVGGEAVLTTGSGSSLYSAVLVQGDDGFFNFASPITLGAADNYLNFDVNFADIGVDLAESSSSGFLDSLNVALYDALDFMLDLTLWPGINTGLGAGWHRFSLDVSTLAGRDVALSFELTDADDGRNSSVRIDNITFTSTPDVGQLPTPATVILITTGLALISRKRSWKGESGLSKLCALRA